MQAVQRAALRGVLAFACLAGLPPVIVAQEAALSTRPALTPEQMETFLLKAKIVATKDVGTGVTNTRRATLSDGQVTHDAQIQIVNMERVLFQPARGPAELNFKDSYRYNIAGYRLARELGLNNVPMSVERTVQGHAAAVTWWIDDVMMDEGARKKRPPVAEWKAARTSAQLHIMRVFDALIANTDRNLGNLLWTKDGTMWMIDHTRAFRLAKKLNAPALLQRCDRTLLEGLRSLSLDKLRNVMGDMLGKTEIEALLARRDAIVQLFDEKIAVRGEATILYRVDQP